MPVSNVRVNASNYAEEGYTKVTWSASAAADHYAYRVYRRNADLRGDWQLVRQRTDIASSYSVEDYFAPSSDQLYAVVEVHVNNSVQTEDDKRPILVQLYTPYYWLVHPDNHNLDIKMRHITGDEFSNERQYEVKKLIGRGRKIDVGDDWGKQGTLTGRIYDRPDRTARQLRLDIEEARDLNSHWFLRNPFGDFWRVWWSDPQFSRIAGVGGSEFVDMSFEYLEVA